MLARSDDVIIVPILLFSAIALALLWAGAVSVREWMNPKQIGRRLRKFVLLPLDKLEIHEKTYPGYDLASVNLALASFQEDCCAGAVAVGAVSHSLHDIVSGGPNAYAYKQKATKPTYERLPVDVD